MSTIVAVHRNPTLVYARLRARGKPGQEALTACMRNFSLSSAPYAEAELPSINYINLF
jgi:hypothetical protein